MSSAGRRLRNVRANRAIRAFHRLGYETVRVRGSHHVLMRPDGSMLVLPMHRGTLKAGILLDAIERAGISVEEFEELLLGEVIEYSVVVHEAEEGGFLVDVPALPGCYSQGESLEETLENVREAISLYLEMCRDEGRDAPDDADVVFQVSVPVQQG